MPRKGAGLTLAAALAIAAVPAFALDFDFVGYADVRLLSPGAERSWLDGGLGKLR